MGNLDQFDVAGFAHAPVDIIVKVTDDFLNEFGFNKAASNLLNNEQDKILQNILKSPLILPGGACANTLSGIGRLGGKCIFNSRMANDEHSKLFRNALINKYNVTYSGEIDPESSCDRIYTFITPDHERTFGAFHGSSKLMTPDNVDKNVIASSKMFYIEGYVMDIEQGQEILIKAASTAKALNKQVVFCPNGIHVIKEYRNTVDKLLEYTDILIMNTDESSELTGKESPLSAVKQFSGKGYIGAVTCGKDGAIVFNADTVLEMPAYPLSGPLINTNGAGDQFAAGFLFGLSQNYNVERCAMQALKCAAEVLTNHSARPCEYNASKAKQAI